MSITAYENIEDINKNITDQGQYITANDLFVILQGKDPVTNFGTCESDILELSVYDINNNLLPNIFGNDIEYIKYPNINQYLTPDGTTIQLKKLLNYAGFKSGIFKVSLSFVRKRAGDEGEYRRFWIQEVAASRTEIRVIPLQADDLATTSLNVSDLDSLQREDTDFETIKNSITSQLSTINEVEFAKKIEDYFKNRYATLGETIFFDILKTDFLLTLEFKVFVQEIITNYKLSVEYYFLNRNYDINGAGFGQLSKVAKFSTSNCNLYNSSDITIDLNNILISCINWSVNKYLATRITAIAAGSQTANPYTSTFVNSTQNLNTNGVILQTITQPILNSGNYTIAFNDAAIPPVVQTTTTSAPVYATTTITPVIGTTTTTAPIFIPTNSTTIAPIVVVPTITNTTTQAIIQPPTVIPTYYYYTVTACNGTNGLVIGPFTTNKFNVNTIIQDTSTTYYYTVVGMASYNSQNANVPTGFVLNTNINQFIATVYVVCPSQTTTGPITTQAPIYWWYSLKACQGTQVGQVWSMRYSTDVFAIGAVVIDSTGAYWTVNAKSNTLANGVTQVGINPTAFTTCPPYNTITNGGTTSTYIWFKLRPCDKLGLTGYTSGLYDVYSDAQIPTTYVTGERVLGGTGYYYTIVGQAYTLDPDPTLTTGPKVQISRLGNDPATNMPYMGCPNGGTVTTVATYPPITITNGAVTCNTTTNTGIVTSTFSGGNGTYSFAAVGTSPANALQKVNSTTVGDRITINNANPYTFTGLISGYTYYIAVMDNAGNVGASSTGVVVNCGVSNLNAVATNWYKMQLCNSTTIAYSQGYPANSYFSGQIVADITGQNTYTIVGILSTDPYVVVSTTNSSLYNIVLQNTVYSSCPGLNTGGSTGGVGTITTNSAGQPITTMK